MDKGYIKQLTEEQIQLAKKIYVKMLNLISCRETEIIVKILEERQVGGLSLEKTQSITAFSEHPGDTGTVVDDTDLGNAEIFS